MLQSHVSTPPTCSGQQFACRLFTHCNSGDESANDVCKTQPAVPHPCRNLLYSTPGRLSARQPSAQPVCPVTWQRPSAQASRAAFSAAGVGGGGSGLHAHHERGVKLQMSLAECCNCNFLQTTSLGSGVHPGRTRCAHCSITGKWSTGKT